MCERVISLCDALRKLDKLNIEGNDQSMLEFYKDSALQSVKNFLLEVSQDNPP